MNYKKFIKNRSFRLLILRILSILPDKIIIIFQFKIKMGFFPDLKHPKTFNEKLQWYKLNYRNTLMTVCADKVNVRKFVKSKGLENILIPIYGVFDCAEDIDYDVLPNSFVLKTSNGSHTNVLCKNKKNLDIIETNNKLNKWLSVHNERIAGEWAYYNIIPKIVCEKYLETDLLLDYKFFCFYGEVEMLYICAQRNKDGEGKISLFDKDMNLLPYRRKDIDLIDFEIKKPKNYSTMLEIASLLSKDFPHVRVDLYNIDGKIYFGEMTFYNASGYGKFDPELLDELLGNKFILPSKT